VLIAVPIVSLPFPITLSLLTLPITHSHSHHSSFNFLSCFAQMRDGHPPIWVSLFASIAVASIEAWARTCRRSSRAPSTHGQPNKWRFVSLQRFSSKYLFFFICLKQFMERMGNTRAKEIWEAKLPANFERPNHTDKMYFFSSFFDVSPQTQLTPQSTPLSLTTAN